MTRRFIFIYIMILMIISGAAAAAAESEFLLESYVYEIEYSSLQELRAWSDRLGLHSRMGEDELREQLYNHYGIDKDQFELTTAEDSVLKVSISHADTVSYDEFIRLTGDVSVSITDADTGAETNLSADTVIIDNEKRQLSAIGNVTIESIRENENTTYSADTILIRYDDMEGILSNAVTRSDRVNSEEDTIEFYLTGDRVALQDETMILNNSFLTSDVKNSYYGLKASTMKALPDGDWFLEDAVLTLGRVPIIYLPFFYYPANTFSFHPAFGYDEERGWFLNTSLSLLGSGIDEEKGEESSFSSFMRMQDIEKTPYLSHDGFLITYQEEAQNDLQEWAQETKSYVNLYTDVFQDSGLFISIDSVLNDILLFEDISLFTGLGYSGTDAIRYILEFSTEIKEEHINLSVDMPIYSDPDIKQEMTERKSVFDLDDLFGADAFSDDVSDVDDYEWQIESSGSWSPKLLDPFVEKIKVSSLDIEVAWDDYDDSTGTYLLDSVTLPDLDLSVSGKLIDVSLDGQAAEQADSEEEPEPSPELSISGPGYTEQAENKTYEKEHLVFGQKDDLTVSSSTSQEFSFDEQLPLTISLGYNIEDSFTDELNFDDDSELQYIDLDQRLSGDLDLDIDLFGDLFTISDTVSPVYDIDHRTSYDSTIDSSDEQEFYVSQDLLVSSSILDLSYQLKSYLYQEDSSVDTVLKHRLTLSETIGGDDTNLQISLVSNLPPITMSFTPSMSLNYKDLDLSFSTSYVEDDDTGDFELDPIKVKASYDFSQQSSASLSYSHDLETLEDSLLTTSYSIGFSQDLKLSGSLDFDLFDRFFDSGWTKLAYDDAYASVWYENIETATSVFDEGLGLTSFKIYTGKHAISRRYWKNRISFETGFSSSWYLDFTDYYDNSLDFSFYLNFGIAEFLDIEFSSKSKNSATYTYFPNFNDGSSPGFFEDLLMSFNFFDTDDRLASNFNLDSLSVGIVHYMKDWDVHADIIGEIGYNDSDNVWEWQPTFSFYVQWKAIPELDFETEVESDDGSYTLSVE